jgi:site-specific DNA-methyltransferase (adenine-specific)
MLDRFINGIGMEDKTRVYNQDCMIGMKEFPDKYFDLAIVDVPYGIGVNHNMGRRKGDRASGFKPADWDSEAPPSEYFDELRRVSENQIVWGANHFISRIPHDSSCWILWDKGFSEDVSFAQFELAWTSSDSVCKKYDKPSAQPNRIHPTQKPVALYKWLLKNYAKEGDKILDTHLGSQSSRIAAFDGGFDFTGYELDKDYFEAGCKRFNQHKQQLKLFV